MSESLFPNVSEEQCDINCDLITDVAFPMTNYIKLLEENDNNSDCDLSLTCLM